MLQIYLFGPSEEGFLDIDPDTSLQMESLTEIFADEEENAGDFSLPVDFPWTENNRRKFGFTERLENFGTKEDSWRCIVYDSGFPELPNAKLTMLEKSGNFSYSRGKFSASISGNKGLFGSAIKNKNLRDLALGGAIRYTTSSRQFAENVMKGVFPSYAYLAFAPVAIEKFIDDGRPDYSGEFLAKDTVNTVVNSGGGADDWSFANPAGANAYDYRTIPFFKLKYVLRKIFEESGYTLSGAFIDEAGFDDLVIFNNYSLEYYDPATGTDYNRNLVPANHMPNLPVADFLSGFFSFFNLYPDFTGATNDIKLYYKKASLTDKRILSLNDICSNEFSAAYQEQGAADGYKINYVWDSNDQYYSDRVKEDIAKDKTITGTVATFGALEAYNIGRSLTTDDLVYVEAENMYYQVADATSTPKKWDAHAERLNGYKTGAGETSVDVNMSTLCSYVEFVPADGLYERRNYVGCRQGGSYVNNKGVRVLNDFGPRIFYIKRLPVGGSNIPVSFNQNRDAGNGRIVPYSLAWQGSDGLALNFHRVWQSMRLNAEIVKTSVKGSRKALNDLAVNNCCEINNVLFLPYKIERDIPMKGSIEISLIAL